MTKKSLDLVVEVGSCSSTDSDDIKWPRDDYLFKWIGKLIPGDLIDASDEYQKWFESTVVRVTPLSMMVHFKGWGSTFDEVIQSDDYKKRIAPLYTKTKNWRADLKVGSEVEYTKVVLKTGSKWLPGIVTEVDHAFDTVTVKFKQQDDIVKQQTDIALDSEQVW